MRDEHAFLTAKEFFDAYLVLSENNWRTREEMLKDNPHAASPAFMQRLQSGELKSTMVPNIVCLSFAIELYLKSLLAKLNQSPTKLIHHLKELYDLLPAANRSKLIDDTSIHFGNPLSEQEFSENLSEIANSFVEWRYFHEKGEASFHLKFGECFARAVAQQVLIP